MRKLERKMIEDLALHVQKPARYLGGELNSIVKEEEELRVAISYPDLYDVGMSNNGIRVLYDAANRIDGVACERVFAVQADMEAILRERNVPLFTLETLTPLGELHAIGFNLSHELLFTNMLQVLDLGGIPLLARDRGEGDPIVMAGGSAVSNPFPASDFIDLVFIGDGEEGFPEILSAMKGLKRRGARRSDILDELSSIEGVLIPSRYRFRYDGMGIAEIAGKEVCKRIFRGSGSRNPLAPIVPSIRITQARAVYEIARGCSNFCRFCHAGYYELPYRTFPHDRMAEEILRIIDNTGYDELSLSALSIGDYRGMAPLLNRILPALSARGVSISLPSLRVDMRTIPIIEKISDLRKTSLTFAVESGSQDIRWISNKRIRDDDLYAIVGHVFRSGWKLIKLYFMIGLPGCMEHDEAGSIAAMLKRVKSAAGSGSEINVTLSPFVPKPHTPFQRERQFSADYFSDVIGRIRGRVHRSIKIKSHDVASSVLEGVMSRGDARLGAAILGAYRDGCRFDSWKEQFRFDIWKRNLDLHVPGWESYLGERKGDDILPWSVVKTGFERVTAAMGMDHGTFGPAGVPSPPALPDHPPLDTGAIDEALAGFREKYRVTSTARFRVEKTGPARFIPHLDFIEVIKRGCRMAGLPVSFSQGFNKRERLSFGYPLPLGIESVSELFDADLYAPMPEDAAQRLQGRFPQGIRCVSWRMLGSRESLMSVTSNIEYQVETASGELSRAMVKSLGEEISFEKETKEGSRMMGFRSVVAAHASSGEGSFSLRLHAGTPDSLRIDRVVMALAGVDMERTHEIRIVKVRQFRSDGSEIL